MPDPATSPSRFPSRGLRAAPLPPQRAPDVDLIGNMDVAVLRVLRLWGHADSSAEPRFSHVSVRAFAGIRSPRTSKTVSSPPRIRGCMRNAAHPHRPKVDGRIAPVRVPVAGSTRRDCYLERRVIRCVSSPPWTTRTSARALRAVEERCRSRARGRTGQQCPRSSGCAPKYRGCLAAQ